MAVLIYECADGPWPEKELEDRPCLGADSDNDLCLPAEMGVAGVGPVATS